MAEASLFIASVAETAKQDQSRRIMALSDIRDIFDAHPGADRLPSAELAHGLGAMENCPWSEWRNGKAITPAAARGLLAPIEIIPGTHRDGEHTFKGYLRSDFAEAFAAYLADQTVTPSQPNNGGLSYASPTVTLDRDVTVSKASQPNNDGHCDDVTVQNGAESPSRQMATTATSASSLARGRASTQVYEPAITMPDCTVAA